MALKHAKHVAKARAVQISRLRLRLGSRTAGNIPGAMLGGFFLGMVESVGPTLFLYGLGIPAPYQLRDLIAFTLLIMVLIFRPQGLLGERMARKRA